MDDDLISNVSYFDYREYESEKDFTKPCTTKCVLSVCPRGNVKCILQNKNDE